MKDKEQIKADRTRRKEERAQNKEKGRARKENPVIDALFKAQRDSGNRPTQRTDLTKYTE
jgi:hypothetical protein